MKLNDVEAWLQESPFTRDLGVRWEDGALSLPYDEPHTRHGDLHGGAIAALVAISAQATLRASGAAGPPSTVSLHVNYARRGRGKTFTTATSVVRCVWELGFFETRVVNEDGDVVANASAALATDRAGGGRVTAQAPLPGDPAEFVVATQSLSFLTDRGLRIEGIDRGRLEMTMAPAERNLDRDGTIHEGALLTLIDAAGASVAWTLGRPSTAGATIALHAQILGRLPSAPVKARAAVRAHDSRFSWCDVSVFGTAEQRLCGLGTVVHRFG